MTNDPYAAVKNEMGYGSDEPATFLRLKNEGDTEVVTLETFQTVPANQRELEKGYHTEGKTVQFSFLSPLTGKERTHRTNGLALLIGMENATSYERDAAGMAIIRKVMPGETCKIVRTGQGGDTRLNVTILSPDDIRAYVSAHGGATPDPAPVEPMTPAAEQENVNIDDLPF